MKTPIGWTAMIAAMTLAASAGAQTDAGHAIPRDQLPTGKLTVGGVSFEARADQVKVVDSGGDAPVVIAEWPGGRKATGLAFLQTYLPGRGIDDWRAATGLAYRKLELPPEWPTVFTYEIEYADGGKLAIPVRFGESIREWYRVHTVGPMLWARENWTKDLAKNTGEKLAVYAMRIPNPRPDQPIAAVRALPAADAYRDFGTAWVLASATTDEPLTGKLYFVDRKPIGDDAQPGTLEQPFGTVQHALDVARPGDTVYIRGALYALDAPMLKEFNGEAGKWLTISAFPGETPVFDGLGIQPDYRARPYGDRETNVGRYEWDTGVIHVWGDPDYTRIQGLQIRNSQRAAISVYGNRAEGGGAWGDTDHVEIAFNTTCRSYSMGIISHQTNDIRVIGNRVIRPHALDMAFDVVTGEPISKGELPQEAIDLSRNRNFEIAFNTVAGGGKEAIDCISVEDGQVHHNYVDSALNGIYIDSWSVPIYRLDIHHNFIVNAYAGIPLATEGSSDLMDFDIHHNIVIDSKSGGIMITEATYKAKPAKVQKHRVHNNTVDGTGGHAIAIGWQASGIGVAGFPDNENFRDVDVVDNIITNTVGRPMTNRYGDAPEKHNISFTRNLVWPTSDDSTPQWMRSDKAWRASDLESGQKTIVADPDYVDPAAGDYRLADGSPAIGAGKDGGDLGALPHGTAWIAGLDFAGHTTSFYRGPTLWRPLTIDREKFTMHRNHLQRPSWFQRGRYGPDFRDLPDGEQSFAGVTYFLERDDQNSLPTLLVLAGHSSEAKAEAITGLTVARKADRLAFLHNAHVANRGALGDGGLIFHYRVNYADGSHVDVPIRLGREIGDWMQDQVDPVREARIAWTQRVDHKRGKVSHLNLYSYVWTNPRPDAVIASIDILRDADPLAATPAVFAISTGTDRP